MCWSLGLERGAIGALTVCTAHVSFVLPLCATHVALPQTRTHIHHPPPVLAPSITWLELDFRTYRLLHKLVHTALSNQSWPQLNTLILHPKLSRGHAADCGPVISPATWAAVFEPLLVQLTRLDFGSRECVPAAGSDGGGEGGGDRQQAEGGSSRKASPPPAAASEAEAAGEAGSGLVHLKCSGLDSPWDNDAWCLNWLGSRHCRNLTALEISLCSAGELDFDVLAQLKHLVTLSLHHFEDECVTAAQLAPLSACCCLTQLRMEALIVERPAQLTAAALGAQAAAQAATQAAAEFVPTNIVESAGGSAPLSTTAATHVRTAAQAEAVFVGPSMVGPPPPRLTSLQRLTAGLLCKAPLSCWVPNLTRLSDVSREDGWVCCCVPTALHVVCHVNLSERGLCPVCRSAVCDLHLHHVLILCMCI